MSSDTDQPLPRPLPLEEDSVLVTEDFERPAPAEPDLVGQLLNGYGVTRLLAEGGTSWVFEAVHPEIGRRAAVKVLKDDIAHDTEWRGRFLREAQVVASVTNRNVAEIWNYGTLANGRQYLMMPLLQGEALDLYMMREGAFSVSDALDIIEQVLGGLSVVHQKGIVHRDVKPGNVFLTRELDGEFSVRVMDFGIATGRVVKLESEKGDVKQSTIAGTPVYVAPEQAMGQSVSPRSDLYSLGIMLYEMLAGQPPFMSYPGQPIPELLRMHTSHPPPELSTKVTVPVELNELVHQLLDKDPTRRPQSAEAVRQQVRALRASLKGGATPRPRGTYEEVGPESYRQTDKDIAETKHAPTQQLPKKSRASLIGIVALLLVGVVVGGIGLFGGGESKKPVVVEAPPKPPENPVIAAVTAEKVTTPTPAQVAAEKKLPESIEPEPLPPTPAKLPAAASATAKKQSVKVLSPSNRAVEITAVEACADLERWRIDENQRADDIRTRVRELLSRQNLDLDELERRLATQKPVVTAIRTANSAERCLAASRALNAWAEKNGL